MTDRFQDVPGGRLFVVDEGSGPPIVLLHAGIADQRSWNYMAPLLHASGYRTIRYDQRGAGRTVTEDVSFSRIDDLVAVLDASGITRAVLVGNSMASSPLTQRSSTPTGSWPSWASAQGLADSMAATRPRS